MSLLFSFFLCSHYTSFPLSIFNLLFYSPLPFFFCFSHPFVISLFVSHPSPLIPHPDFTFVSYSTFDFPLSPFPPSFGHPVIPPYFCFFLPLVPPSLPPLLPLLLCRVWEVTTGEVLNTLIHHNEAVLHLRFANGLMVTCSKDRSIAVWDMASPTDISLRRVLVGHRAAVNVVDFDDKYIVSASGDRTIKVTRATVHELKETNLIKSA